MSRWQTVFSLASLLAPAIAGAEALRDLADRIDFGFYGGDAAVVGAAARELESYPASDEQARYLHGLANFRLAALGPGSRIETPALSDCIDSAGDLAEANPENAEAHVLVAACSLQLARVESLKGIVHQRRAQRALAAARATAPDNPRVAYVTVLATLDELPAREVVAALEQATAGFRTYGGDGPLWGEAETYLLLAGHYLDLGSQRQARDAVERALLVAPGFAPAIALRDRLNGSGN